jgi:hypothetical protein
MRFRWLRNVAISLWGKEASDEAHGLRFCGFTLSCGLVSLSHRACLEYEATNRVVQDFPAVGPFLNDNGASSLCSRDIKDFCIIGERLRITGH